MATYSTQRNPKTGATITFKFVRVVQGFGAGYEQCASCKSAVVLHIAAVDGNSELIDGTEFGTCRRHQPSTQVKIAKKLGVL